MIFALSGKATGRVLNRAIAGELKINPATVTEMLRRLRDKKLVEYSRSGGAALTKTGKDIALIEIIAVRDYDKSLNVTLDGRITTTLGREISQNLPVV
ncbi:MAG TPA: hypothetical protein VMG09_07000 [Bacteroidota bacterium]|nr:hypothetical protein [Bacteroidota bacterium]